MRMQIYVMSLVFVSALNASDEAILERLRGQQHGRCMTSVLSKAVDGSLTYASVQYGMGHDSCDQNTIFVLDETSVRNVVITGAEECVPIHQIAMCGDDMLVVQYNFFGNRFFVFRSNNKLTSISKIVDRNLRDVPSRQWTCEELQSMMSH